MQIISYMVTDMGLCKAGADSECEGSLQVSDKSLVISFQAMSYAKLGKQLKADGVSFLGSIPTGAFGNCLFTCGRRFSIKYGLERSSINQSEIHG